jgi:catechol 2,3-dioxygenase-like lactoylglutathione lyase family enzyme
VRAPFFTDCTQIGIVVRDLEATVRRYVDDYGIGPWSIYDFGPDDIRGQTLNGSAAEFGVRVALSTIGSVQIELLQPLDDISDYALFLKTKGEGVHHIALEVADPLPEALEELEAKGRRVLQGGTIDGLTHAYISTDEDLGFVAEIGEATPGAALRPPDAVVPNVMEDRA